MSGPAFPGGFGLYATTDMRQRNYTPRHQNSIGKNKCAAGTTAGAIHGAIQGTIYDKNERAASSLLRRILRRRLKLIERNQQVIR
jgi:hypothetical protein